MRVVVIDSAAANIPNFSPSNIYCVKSSSPSEYAVPGEHKNKPSELERDNLRDIHKTNCTFKKTVAKEEHKFLPLTRECIVRDIMTYYLAVVESLCSTYNHTYDVPYDVPPIESIHSTFNRKLTAIKLLQFLDSFNGYAFVRARVGYIGSEGV